MQKGLRLKEEIEYEPGKVSHRGPTLILECLNGRQRCARRPSSVDHEARNNGQERDHGPLRHDERKWRELIC